MSTITASDNPVSDRTDVSAASAGSRAVFVAPPQPIWKQLNWQMLLVIGIVILPVFFFFYQWARQAFSHGVINHGSYYEVNLKAMSNFDMDQINGQPSDIPAIYRDLDGKRVMFLGQMYSPNYAGDESMLRFTFCYNRAKCCFTGNPLAQHMVDSVVQPGVKAYYTDGEARVWGTLHIRFARDKDTPKIHSVYEVDVDKVEDLD